VIIICDLRGRILWVGEPSANLHDQSLWNSTDIRERFHKKSYGMLADGGFFLNPQNQRIKINGITPIRRVKGGTLKLAQRKLNQVISQWRVIIENAIGQVKKWGILGGKLRHYTAGGPNTFPTDKLVKAVCILTQRKLAQNPLRAENWVNDTARAPKDFGDEFIIETDGRDEPADEKLPPKRVTRRNPKLTLLLYYIVNVMMRSNQKFKVCSKKSRLFFN
jgi:hypothetical protein